MQGLIRRGRHLTTVHEPGEQLNDTNPGRYLTVLLFTCGYYLNSHSIGGKSLVSRYAGLSIYWAGLTYSVGLITGYPGSIVLPYLSISERVRIGGRWHRLFYIPRTILNSSALHAAIED